MKTKTKISLHSDLHYEFNREDVFQFGFPGRDADVLILAGDCTVANTLLADQFFLKLRKTFDGPILYVLGNHEFYGSRSQLFPSQFEAGDFDRVINFYMELGKTHEISILHNEAVELNGVVFAGTTLWSGLENNSGLYCGDVQIARSLRDFSCVPEMTPDFMRDRYKEATEFLCKTAGENKGQTLFFITHFAPSLENRNTRFSLNGLTDYFATGAGRIAELYPTLNYWAYGHTHGTDEVPLSENCVTITNQLGYPNEPSGLTYRPEHLIEIEQWKNRDG